MSADSFISDSARELALRILNTAPDGEGQISPLDVIRSIEHDISVSENHQTDRPEPPELLPFEDQNSITGIYFAKMSDYLRDVVEDSAAVLSNEPLNEATIAGCIRTLEAQRAAQSIRDAKEALNRDDLTVQQRKDNMHSLMELMRAHRGSTPGS